MLQCIFRLCVRVLKLGYNGVVGGVFGFVFGQFFRRRGSFFLFFAGRLLVAFLVVQYDFSRIWRDHAAFFSLFFLINKVSPRFLFLLFGDECRRRQ